MEVKFLVCSTLVKAGTVVSVCLGVHIYRWRIANTWILAPIPKEYKLPVGTIFYVVAGIDVAPLYFVFVFP